MSPWAAFLLGMLAGGASLGALGAVLLRVAASTPTMALASLGALLRGFSEKVEALSIVVVCDRSLAAGENLLVPFDQLATAIENADVARITTANHTLN